MSTQMNTGNYATDSELIRETLCEKQSRMADVELIRTALLKGEQSGISNRTPDDIMQSVID